MAPPDKPLRRRCRPLRRESDEHLWFVTSRVLEERMLLHPILTCGLEPPNRRARRNVKHLERHADKRLKPLVARANVRRGPYQPELTLDFPEAHTWTGEGIAHLDLLDRGEVYDTIRAWLSPSS